MNFSNRIGTPYYILTSIINPNKRKYKMGVDIVSITRYTPYNNAKRSGRIRSYHGFTYRRTGGPGATSERENCLPMD